MCGNSFIAILLGDDPVTREGSPETLRNQKVVKGRESRQRYSRGTHFHAGARR